MFGDCKGEAAKDQGVQGFSTNYEAALGYSLNQAKGNSSKCFRYKSQSMKLWDQKVDYNYYPVCYESVCV